MSTSWPLQASKMRKGSLFMDSTLGKNTMFSFSWTVENMLGKTMCRLIYLFLVLVKGATYGGSTISIFKNEQWSINQYNTVT